MSFGYLKSSLYFLLDFALLVFLVRREPPAASTTGPDDARKTDMHMRAMVKDTNFILETWKAASLLGIKTIAANVGVRFQFVSRDAPREVYHTPVTYNMPKLFLAIDGGGDLSLFGMLHSLM